MAKINKKSQRVAAVKLPTQEEALNEIRTKPLIDIYPTMCVALNISRGSGYAAVNRGEIEVMEIGRLKKPLTAPLRRKLGLDRGTAWQQVGSVAERVVSNIKPKGE